MKMPFYYSEAIGSNIASCVSASLQIAPISSLEPLLIRLHELMFSFIGMRAVWNTVESALVILVLINSL